MDQMQLNVSEDVDFTKAEELKARIRAYDLNKELYPRKTTIVQEMKTFWTEGVLVLSDYDINQRMFVVDSGAS